jgi:hypothetical protein
MDVFVPNSGQHLVALVVCAMLLAALTLLGRVLYPGREAILRRMLAALAVC